MAAGSALITANLALPTLDTCQSRSTTLLGWLSCDGSLGCHVSDFVGMKRCLVVDALDLKEIEEQQVGND